MYGLVRLRRDVVGKFCCDTDRDDEHQPSSTTKHRTVGTDTAMITTSDMSDASESAGDGGVCDPRSIDESAGDGGVCDPRPIDDWLGAIAGGGDVVSIVVAGEAGGV